MCGLVGAFTFADSAGDDLVGPVRRLTARLARRGPDDEGSWTDGVRCALGFRRLSILDLSPAGHQPMLTADGQHVLVFNGEIYNYRELRDRLATRGITPRSTGDAEVLLLALREWGTEVLRDLNGMFALAFYAVRDRRLLLARDHVGIKPLHFARTSRGVVFGSQYDVVLGHPWMAGASVERTALGLYLRFGFVPAPYGLHGGARQLEAGTWLEVDATGRERTGVFFEAPRDLSPDLHGDDAVDAFDAAFARAVKRQLVADVPVGVFLSGGIDSPLVAAEAARQHGGGLRAFTIEVDDERLDESADARRYAEDCGLAYVGERVTAAAGLAVLDDVVAAATEPLADYSMFPTLLVSRLARQHATVALSGDGGDELYWGYPSRFGSAIEQAPWFALPRRARYAGVAARRVGIGHATRDVVEHDTIGALYRKKHTMFSAADLDAVFPALPPLPVSFTTFDCDESDPDRVARWVRWNELRFHLARVLQKVDRASMHASLEVRVPLLDREVIDVAWRTDWRSCLDVRQRRGKKVLRAALARRVRHQTTAKRGFEVPMADWLTTALRPLVEELLLGRDAILDLPVRRGAIAELERRLRAGDRSKAWGLWLLLALALWERRLVGESSV